MRLVTVVSGVLRPLLLVFCLGVLVACASKPTHKDATPLPERLEEMKLKDAVDLKLGSEPGRIETVKYVSRTLSQSVEGKAVRRQEEQKASFTVQTKTGSIDEKDDLITQTVRTVEKVGDLDLRALAMPEVGESIGFILKRDGSVVNVDGYPRGTLFWVAPISLPKGKAEVGDTWDYSAQWLSLEESAPFQLDIISIIKGFVKCGQNDECADIEVSGEVRLSAPIDPVLSFKNTLSGRILFARKAGIVVWSRIDSLETLYASSQLGSPSSVNAVSRRVHSCLESLLLEPVNLKVPSISNPACEAANTPAAYRDL